MSGLGIWLYTDEDVNPHLAEQLRYYSYDALSCHAAGNSNQRLSDEWQLEFAVSQRRAILVHNLPHYVALDARWRRRNREHYGIILVSATTPFAELLRRTRLHLDTYTPEQQYNTVLYLAR